MLKERGLISNVLQVGSTVDENFNGVLTGHFAIKSDISDSAPRIGDEHPKDDRLEVVRILTEYGKNNEVIYRCQCMGLISDPTPWIYTYGTSLNEEAIETHPKDLIGNKENPNNEASFDDDGVFLGFKSTSDLKGIRGYLTGSFTIRRVRYATSSGTGLSSLFKVFPFRPGAIPGLGDSRDALKTGYDPKPIGNFFEISEEFLCSEEGGWNKKVYDSR